MPHVENCECIWAGHASEADPRCLALPRRKDDLKGSSETEEKADVIVADGKTFKSRLHKVDDEPIDHVVSHVVSADHEVTASRFWKANGEKTNAQRVAEELALGNVTTRGWARCVKAMIALIDERANAVANERIAALRTLDPVEIALPHDGMTDKNSRMLVIVRDANTRLRDQVTELASERDRLKGQSHSWQEVAKREQRSIDVLEEKSRQQSLRVSELYALARSLLGFLHVHHGPERTQQPDDCTEQLCVEAMAVLNSPKGSG